MEHLSAIATNLLGRPAYLTAPTNVEGPVTRACEWGHIVYLCRNSVARTVVGLYYADGSVVEHQLDHLYVEIDGYASEGKRPDHYPGPPPSSTADDAQHVDESAAQLQLLNKLIEARGVTLGWAVASYRQTTGVRDPTLAKLVEWFQQL